MADPSRLIIVGADKGGTGKTTVTRALLGRVSAARIVDTEGALRRFYPSAVLMDVAKTEDKMRLFDNMVGTTVMDVRAGLLSPTLKSMHELGLLADVAKGTMKLVVVHVLGPSTASWEEIAPTAAQLTEGGTHILAKNHVSADARFFDFDPATAEKVGNIPIIYIPHLEDRVAEAVDLTGQTFSAFAENNANSLTLRRFVLHWLSRVYPELDRVAIP